MNIKIIANCKCGKIQFASNQKPILQVCCHCTDCREATNNDFSGIAFFKMKSVAVTGELTRQEYLAESQNKTTREFCSNCGCVMFDKSEGFPDLMGVFEQRLNKPFVSHTDCHVWVKSKLPHVNIPITSTQHEKGLS